jgi:hypothetical protein
VLLVHCRLFSLIWYWHLCNKFSTIGSDDSSSSSLSSSSSRRVGSISSGGGGGGGDGKAEWW